jgi:amino acid adenylation domain-containing protein
MATSDQELAERALAGDREALQILRERGRLRSDRRPRWYPLTNAQRRLWLLSQIEGGSVAYNMPVAFFLEEDDRTALFQALQMIVNRHDALRTTFSDRSGIPCQLVYPSLEIAPQYLDLSEDDDPEAQVKAYVEEEVARPFQLDVGPLLRVSLLRVSRRRHLLLLSFHHIICDEWSISVLLRELHSIIDGEELAPLRLQYPDFAVWQQEWLQGEAAASDRRYWHDRLAGEIPALDLPADFVRPPVRSFAGATVAATLPDDMAAALSSFNREHRVSLFVTMVAIVKVLIHRYSGSTDIVVGSPFAGRSRPELEELIGFFANTVALRDRLDSDTPFLALLQQVGQTVTEAYDHQDYPFDLLVDELEVHRGPSRSPLFDVMVALLTGPDQVPAGHGIPMQPLAARTRTSKFDLIFFIDDRDGLQIRIEYSTDLFTEDRIKRLTGHMEALVRGILDDPHRQIGRLPLLTAQERDTILEQFRFGPAEPGFASVVNLFEQQVATAPDATAVVCGDVTWTYQELRQRAGAVAGRLLEQQIRPDDRVAALLGRSQWLPAVALGILEAGAAYLPVDPAYPERRIRQMVESVGCRLIVTDREHVDLARRCRGDLPLVVAGSAWEERDDPAGNELTPVAVQPEQLAYVIFTSGSTGQPKAVMQSHRCLSNLVLWQRQQVGDGWTMLHVAALGFDVSVQELLFNVAAGGTLHIVSEGLRRDPVQLAEYIEEQQIQILILPYSMLNLLLREARWQQEATPLRHLLTSGEKLTMFRELRQLLEAHPEVTLHNQYGPAETHVVTACTFSARRGNLDQPPPIGRPIAGTEILILDRRGEPVPIGVPGEICVAGAGVARGYEAGGRTAAVFVPHPIDTGDRLYRTGDRGCWMADGQIALLGRDDDQVKIRGFRVEPDEVTAALVQQPEIGEAVVTARAGAGGGKELVAYLVQTDGNGRLSLPRLRRRLMEQLPDYMIPACFVSLPRLPINPHGKVDRAALPEPDGANLVPGDEPAPPRDASERLLVDIWEKVLERSGVGIRDSFFDLGGSSFLAVSLMSAIEVHFGERLPLSTLLAGATVEHLAESLRERQRRQSWSPLVVVGGGGKRTPLLFVHPVGGNVLSYYELARLLGPEQPLLMLQALGIEEGQIPFATVEELADYYLEAVRKEQPGGPYLLVGWSFGGLVAYEMARRFEQQGEPVEMLVVIDIHANSSVPEWVDQVDDAGLVEYIFADVVEVSAEEQRALDPGARLAYIVERLQQSDYPLESNEAAHARRLLYLFRSNTLAALKYVPQPYPGRINLFRARDGSRQDDEGDTTLGWGELAGGGVELTWVPGNHQTLVSSPNVEVLARRLSECVDRCRRHRGPGAGRRGGRS